MNKWYHNLLQFSPSFHCALNDKVWWTNSNKRRNILFYFSPNLKGNFIELYLKIGTLNLKLIKIFIKQIIKGKISMLILIYQLKLLRYLYLIVITCFYWKFYIYLIRKLEILVHITLNSILCWSIIYNI